MVKKVKLDPQTAYLQAAPAQYINEKDVLKKAGAYISEWGERVLISGGVRALKAAEKDLTESLDEYGIYWEKNIFKGEVCQLNIDLIKEKAEKMNADLIIGVGGGKAIDTAKAAAEDMRLPVAAVPTIAATCSSGSAFAVVYTEDGQFERDYYMTQNPRLVMVDPQIIAEAPAKYLKSGILDSLAKWYEGKAVESGIDNPGLETVVAMNLAEILYNKMREQAITAVEQCENNRLGKELKEIIDLNIYLTTIIQTLGQNTSSGAAAHGMHNGMTAIAESHELLHGLKVGYGIIIQLYLEQKPQDYIAAEIDFFNQLGLEPSFKGLGLPFTEENLEKTAAKAVNDKVMLRMPIKVTEKMIIEAMKKVEKEVNKGLLI
jgi:glycerol dehydrogenase